MAFIPAEKTIFALPPPYPPGSLCAARRPDGLRAIAEVLSVNTDFVPKLRTMQSFSLDEVQRIIVTAADEIVTLRVLLENCAFAIEGRGKLMHLSAAERNSVERARKYLK